MLKMVRVSFLLCRQHFFFCYEKETGGVVRKKYGGGSTENKESGKQNPEVTKWK